VKPIPLHDGTAPVACRIAASDIPGRVELVGRLRAGLRQVERTEHGLVLRLADEPEIDAALRRFVVDELRCCAFWGFAVEHGAGALVLRWDGPAEAAEILDGLHAYFRGEGPLDALAGLL
jgi:hypothetical protein